MRDVELEPWVYWASRFVFAMFGPVDAGGAMTLEFDPEQCRNESEVESKFIVHYLLPKLGYAPDHWHQEVAIGEIRLDILAFAARALPLTRAQLPAMRLVVEAKHPSKNLDHHVMRLRTYMRTLAIRYGLLTNGKELRVYELVDNEPSLMLRCAGRDVPAHLPELIRLVGHPSVQAAPEAPVEPIRAIAPDPDDAPIAPPPMPIEVALAAALSPLDAPLAVAPKEPTMKTIAIYHNKGGVGKTTTVVNLAAALAERGLRVLVVDLDSQANTTFAMGLVKFDDETQDDLKDCNVAHMLLSDDFYPVTEVARRATCSRHPIDVVPSHISLMSYEPELNASATGQIALSKKLQAVAGHYDVALLDTPPSLNLYARMALVACDHLIIPSDLKPFANQGLLNVLDFIKKTNEFRQFIARPAIDLLGVLPTKIATHAKFVQYSLPARRKAVEERYGVRLMATQIFEREDLAKSTEQSEFDGVTEVPSPLSIFEFKPDSAAAAEFESLAAEVIERAGLMRREVLQ